MISTCCYYMRNNGQSRSQFCIWHDSSAVMSCAKLWSDWMNKIKIREKRILERFWMWAHCLWNEPPVNGRGIACNPLQTETERLSRQLPHYHSQHVGCHSLKPNCDILLVISNAVNVTVLLMRLLPTIYQTIDIHVADSTKATISRLEISHISSKPSK